MHLTYNVATFMVNMPVTSQESELSCTCVFVILPLCPSLFISLPLCPSLFISPSSHGVVFVCFSSNIILNLDNNRMTVNKKQRIVIFKLLLILCLELN